MFILKIEVLKVRIVNVGFKPFSPQGGTGSFLSTESFLSTVYFCATGEMCGESLSWPFLFHCGYSLVYLTYQHCSGSFWIFFKGIWPLLVVDSMCLLKELNLGASCVASEPAERYLEGL